MNEVVFDASAMLALLHHERGEEKLTADLLARSVASTVNLAEVQSKLVKNGATRCCLARCSLLRQFSEALHKRARKNRRRFDHDDGEAGAVSGRSIVPCAGDCAQGSGLYHRTALEKPEGGRSDSCNSVKMGLFNRAEMSKAGASLRPSAFVAVAALSPECRTARDAEWRRS